MHISLFFFFINGVERLRISERAECERCEHLCLTAGEEARAMHARKNADLGAERAHLVQRTPVNAFALVEDPASDNILLQLVEALVNGGGAVGIFGGQLLLDFVHDRRETRIAHGLVVRVERFLHTVVCKRLHRLIKRMRRLGGNVAELLLADIALDLVNKCDNRLEHLVRL